MKLYATTTSERASKGQGGNKYVDIVLQAGAVARAQVARIKLEADKEEEGVYYLEVYTAGALRYTETIEIESEIKGKQVADKEWGRIMAEQRTRRQGGVKNFLDYQQKGKQQKGECKYVTEDSNYCDTHGTDRAH